MYGYDIKPDWLEFFANNKARLSDIFSIILQDPHVIPSLDIVFRPFELTALRDVNVVIIGQNPYNAMPGMANGIAFSVNPEVGTSATLETISEEIERCYNKRLKDTTLRHWIRQGVLLLNSTLTTTVKGNDPEFVHDDLWTFFMENLIHWISRNKPHTIFMLWGKTASRYTKILKGSDTIVIKAPFPLSRNMHGDTFVGSNTFIECDKAMLNLGKGTINWSG
jgi:uracil-DNA glycosylase